MNATWGLWSIDLMPADLGSCLTLANELKGALPSGASAEARLITDYMLGVTQAYRGALEDAAGFLQSVSDAYDPDLSEQLKLRFGM